MLRLPRKCSASSENVAKVLRLPHKTTSDKYRNMLECHEVPRLPREMKLCNAINFQKWPFLQNLPQARPYGPHANGLRTAADGCERKRIVGRTQLYPHTPRVKREPLLRIREQDEEKFEINQTGKVNHHDISIAGACCG